LRDDAIFYLARCVCLSGGPQRNDAQRQHNESHSQGTHDASENLVRYLKFDADTDGNVKSVRLNVSNRLIDRQWRRISGRENAGLQRLPQMCRVQRHNEHIRNYHFDLPPTGKPNPRAASGQRHGAPAMPSR
jgi:hypothetical protein